MLFPRAGLEFWRLATTLTSCSTGETELSTFIVFIFIAFCGEGCILGCPPKGKDGLVDTEPFLAESKTIGSGNKWPLNTERILKATPPALVFNRFGLIPPSTS
ncbi:hypothetical protein, partial [Vibrio anguillarum]|uniref:hypothetical protein n=1 Tax=Vibrio anguillarum TaxID=55601 RepID=UPI001BE46BBA